MLIRRLGLPKPYVRGLLETLWDVANECGNPVIGNAELVEAAAEWPGDAGLLFAALRDLRWIDELPGDKWEIHDYFDHCPDYVRKRAEREWERESRGQNLSEVRRKAAKKRWDKVETGANGMQTDANENHLHTNGCKWMQMDANDQPPAPAPAPAPNKGGVPPLEPPLSEQNEPTPRPRPRKPKNTTTVAPGFDDFWTQYPRHEAKVKAIEAWNRLSPDPKTLDGILVAISRQRASEQWLRDGGRYIPLPATYLNQRRWEDAPAPAVVKAPLFDSEAFINRGQNGTNYTA